MRFHLAAVHQGVGGADPGGGGKAPEAGWHVGRRVHHEDHIQHLVAEIEDELAEVAVAVDGDVDVAAAAVPDDDAVAEVGVDVLEYPVLFPCHRKPSRSRILLWYGGFT